MNIKATNDKSNRLPINEPKLLIQAAEAILSNTAEASSAGLENQQVQHARILLNVALRELEHGPSLEGLDLQAQQQFGFDDQANLVEKIRDGELLSSPELMEYLKRRALLRLMIDNPNYWGYVEAKKRWLSNNGAVF